MTMSEPQTTRTIFGIDPAWRAPWHRRLMAKLFGKKFLGSDGTAIVVGRFYHGKFYIEDVRYD